MKTILLYFLIQKISEEYSNECIAHSSNTTSKIVESTLKTVEIIYKKYLLEANVDDNNNNNQKKNESDYVMEKKSSFIEECHQNFTDDIELINIEKINKLIKTSLKLVNKNENLNDAILAKLKLNFKTTSEYLSVYNQLITTWLCYSTDCHMKSCKFLNILLFIFTEFKAKGLKVPQELQDENDEETSQHEQKNKKFETDDQDAAGLGDGDGIKDVSDQIENEDQLDDAKKQEQRDEEKKEKPDEKPIKEEEKGIEMSENFDDGVLDDVQMEDQEEDRDDNESKDEDDIEDEKGEVDNANNALDEKLWNDEENKDDDDEEDEEKNLEDKIEGGEAMEDQKSELVSKENLPVSKNDKKKNKETSAEEDKGEAEEDLEENDEEEGPEEMNQQNLDDNEDNASQKDEVRTLNLYGIFQTFTVTLSFLNAS